MNDMNNMNDMNDTNNANTATETKKPKNKKKILIISIAVLVAIALIAGGIFIATSLLGEDDEPEVKLPAEVIKNGVAQYTIVYPDNCTDSLFFEITNLISAIRLQTNVNIDYLKASYATDPDANYILIGSTGFDESNAAIEYLEKKKDAFTIETAGKHLVITGHFDTSTSSAVKYFTENILANDYDAATKTLIVDGYNFEGTIPLPATFNSNNISNYVIIYNNNTPGAEKIAKKIQSRLELATGERIDVLKDAGTPETPYEILVGETNRHLSKKYYRDGVELMEYELVVEKGQLQIVCGGLYSAKLGGYALADQILIDGSVSLSTGSHMKTDLAPVTERHSIGTDLRIMTANVLSEGTSASTEKFPESIERAEILANLLVEYTPDFVGCQELDKNFHAALKRCFTLIERTYDMKYELITENYNGKINQNPIIYRADKFRVDEQQFTPMSYRPNATEQYASGMGNAKFTSLSDPSLEIAIISAHWDWAKENEGNNQYIDAMEMADLVKYYEEKYPNVRVFCTGDFNSHRFNELYLKQFLDKIDGVIASSIADANDTLIPSFQHQGRYIDHIIGKKGTFDVLLHSGTENCSTTLTDHQPVFADIKFID